MLQRWDFNDIEALRSFDDAAVVANESAMVHFGRAYVLGPGTNRQGPRPAVWPHASASAHCMANVTALSHAALAADAAPLLAYCAG